MLIYSFVVPSKYFFSEEFGESALFSSVTLLVVGIASDVDYILGGGSR